MTELGAPLVSPSTASLPQRPSLWNSRSRWLLLFLAALLWSLAQAGIFSGEPLLNTGGWTQFTRFWQAAFNPVLTADFLALAARATLVTLAYAVSALSLSLVLGVVLGLLVSEVWWEALWPRSAAMRRGPWVLLRGVLAIPRGIHELLWGLFFLNILGLDPLVAILAIAVPNSAIIAKVFAEILDEAPREPYQALLNSGATPLKAALYGLYPAALADMISFAFYRFECAIRAAAVLGVVGAGGLGFQILLSMQTLNYNETWTLFYALMLLSGAADFWSSQVRRRLGRGDIAWTAYGQDGHSKRPLPGRYDRVLRGSVLAVLVLAPLSFLYLNPTWSLLWSPRTAALLRDIIDQAFPLSLSPSELGELFVLSKTTFAMSILAATVAALVGALLSFPASRGALQTAGRRAAAGVGRSQRALRTAVSAITRALLLLMRAIPAPIWALVLLFIFFPGMLPGALALAIYNAGVLGRLMAEVNENRDRRPAEAIKSTGAGTGEVFLYGDAPAIAPRYVGLSLYRWEEAIRETVVVGLVGAGGLGRALTQALSAFDYSAVLALLICLVILTFAVDLISSAVRKTIR